MHVMLVMLTRIKARPGPLPHLQVQGALQDPVVVGDGAGGCEKARRSHARGTKRHVRGKLGTGHG